MKAVKLHNIVWNLDTVNKEDRKNVLSTLPKVKVFLADDNFDVVTNVPRIIKKKFGYGVFNFSYTEIKIVETVEDLLLLCTPKGMKPKKLFLKNGNLSDFGETLVKGLESKIKERLRMEFNGVSPYEMPKILDEIQLGIEKITGMNWEGHTVEELMSPIMNKIHFANAANLIDKYGEISEEEDED
jgi:hypothetical protein